MKYIVYCRKSTDEKDKQVLSIEAQVAELSEFAKRERLQIVDIVTEARTAKMPGRPQFEYVLQQIEKGVAQGILSWHPDRLARNSVDGGKIIYLLDTGVLKDLKFPSFWFEDTPQGKFMLNIAFGQSKYYVDNLSENVKRGNRQKLRRGEWPGKAPYGYFNNPKTRTIDVDPRTAPIIQKIFLRFAEGKQSFVSISKLLYSHDITRSNGKALHGNQIRKMLTNRFYIGILHYKNEYYEGTHERFISKEVFQNIQRAIQRI
jgi:DNA invertase Pin-like site-specific DNA recombinase